MTLSNDLLQYIDSHAAEAFRLLCELAQIPAPSSHEERRAQFCLDWLRSKGAEGTYIDEALNVIYPIADTGENELMVFMAHSDVVFPDTDPLPLKIENGRISCPGVGDDTANAVALLTVAGYLAETKRTPKGCGVLLVINSGEEGLGNLKGSKQIIEKLHHSVTRIPGTGAYSGKEKDVMMCVLNPSQLNELTKLVESFPGSFVTVSQVNTVVGNFKRLDSRNQPEKELLDPGTTHK